MSSIIAYFSLGNGIYSMTKAAIERFCDALRLEMKKFGVRVSDVMSSCCVKLPAISNMDFRLRKRSFIPEISYRAEMHLFVGKEASHLQKQYQIMVQECKFWSREQAHAKYLVQSKCCASELQR